MHENRRESNSVGVATNFCYERLLENSPTDETGFHHHKHPPSKARAMSLGNARRLSQELQRQQKQLRRFSVNTLNNPIMLTDINNKKQVDDDTSNRPRVCGGVISSNSELPILVVDSCNEPLLLARKDETAELPEELQNRSYTENDTKKKEKPMRLQFWKTRMCKNLDNCRKGSTCNFAHCEQELRPLPDLTKTKMCEEMEKAGRCSKLPFCNYAHSHEELRATREFVKTKLCLRWQQGSCVSSECRFAHGNQELRTSSDPKRTRFISCDVQRSELNQKGCDEKRSVSWDQTKLDESSSGSAGYRTQINSAFYRGGDGIRGATLYNNSDNIVTGTTTSSNSQIAGQLRTVDILPDRIVGISDEVTQMQNGYSQESHVSSSTTMDPASLLQVLSPTSFTNALVYQLTQPQTERTWNRNQSSNQSLTSPPHSYSNTVASSPSNIRQQQLPLSQNSCPMRTYQQLPGHDYSPVAFPLTVTPRNTTNGNVHPPNVQSGQSAIFHQLSPHIAGSTPIHIYSGANCSPRITPMGQSGSENGHYIANLLPPGIFSPMSQTCQNVLQQQILLSPVPPACQNIQQQQILLSYQSDSTVADSVDRNRQSSVQTVNSSDLSSFHSPVDCRRAPNAFRQQIQNGNQTWTTQEVPSMQPGVNNNQHYFLWGSTSPPIMPGQSVTATRVPLIFPVDQLGSTQNGSPNSYPAPPPSRMSTPTRVTRDNLLQANASNGTVDFCRFFDPSCTIREGRLHMIGVNNVPHSPRQQQGQWNDGFYCQEPPGSPIEYYSPSLFSSTSSSEGTSSGSPNPTATAENLNIEKL